MQTSTIPNLQYPSPQQREGAKHQRAQSSKFVPALREREAREAVRLLKALADPTRLQILSLLRHHAGAISVCEIVEAFTLEQPTISHHLRILYDARLVENRRHGLFCYYSIAADASSSSIQPALALLSELFGGTASLAGERNSSLVMPDQATEMGKPCDENHPDRS